MTEFVPLTPVIEDVWRVDTASGSVYMVGRDSRGHWWVSAVNVLSRDSRVIPRGDWPIEPPEPWPPEVGKQLYIAAAKVLPRCDPLRMPGGGKYTSPVRHVTHLTIHHDTHPHE